MEEILTILEETPWWVYLVFVYLVSMGVKAIKPRTVPVKRLVIFPAILTVLGLTGMQWKAAPIVSWGLLLAIGFGLGWFLVRKWKIRYDRGRGTLRLPGTWTTLILALLFFAVKYFFGFYTATHPVVPIEMVAIQSGASGFITGLFIGRLAFFWKRYEEV